MKISVGRPRDEVWGISVWARSVINFSMALSVRESEARTAPAQAVCMMISASPSRALSIAPFSKSAGSFVSRVRAVDVAPRRVGRL